MLLLRDSLVLSMGQGVVAGVVVQVSSSCGKRGGEFVLDLK